MSGWRVNLVSAFGRGETLALALREAGFTVEILDFTSAFPVEYHRGVGPFPIVAKAFSPLQNEYLNEAKPLAHGLNFWLKDGPLELQGPISDIHAEVHPELAAWKKGNEGGEFGSQWLARFLRQWASPFYSDSISKREPGTEFPANQPLTMIPDNREHAAQSFAKVQSRGVDVHMCRELLDIQTQGGKISWVSAEAEETKAFQAHQWVWCLSSSETHDLGAATARKVFPRGHFEPEWAWVCFAGGIQKGIWSTGLPSYSVVVGDIYLPWVYANAFVMRRVDETHMRFWVKVPRNRIHDIDARRGWASEVQKLLNSRLSLADWKVDSAEWGLCPHSEVYSDSVRGETPGSWKNWDWISPENLPRLDVSARLERESESLNRLIQWRNEQLKKQGAPRDNALHAP